MEQSFISRYALRVQSCSVFRRGYEHFGQHDRQVVGMVRDRYYVESMWYSFFGWYQVEDVRQEIAFSGTGNFVFYRALYSARKIFEQIANVGRIAGTFSSA